eukprot:TRINITY_DN110372_c0_g1_i1.p1 TRINITY_DN110372_c0_g1~~TRINITY_DN110372_c0_g1_i1.p1  ORF type:complete len:677 (-),score=176.51 TRINITY_DN110372_c0_g1_i1:14-2044(-)
MAETPEFMLATQAYISKELGSLKQDLLDGVKLQLKQQQCVLQDLLVLQQPGLPQVPKTEVQQPRPNGAPKVSHSSLMWGTVKAEETPERVRDGKVSPFTPQEANAARIADEWGSHAELEHGSEGLPEGMKYMMSMHWQPSKGAADRPLTMEQVSVNFPADLARAATSNGAAKSGKNVAGAAAHPQTSDHHTTNGGDIGDDIAHVDFDAVDEDGDGVIDAEEAARAGIKLSSVDKDGNGVVTKEEFEHAQEVIEIKKGGMFSSNKQDMKLDEEYYDVKNFYKDKGCAQAIARSAKFEKITLGVIAFNALWIGVDADNNFADTMLDADPLFIVADNAFCLFFTFELAVRFLAFARKLNCLKDKWFVFDSFLVGLMVAETWILTATLLFLSSGQGASGPTLPTGPLRLLRLLRLSRLVRLLRSMPELITLISGMKAASRGVGCALTLIVIINYVFAIILNMFLRDIDLPHIQKKFETLGLCMWTLALDGTFMDSTKEDLEQLRLLETHGYDNFIAWAMIITFMGYVLLTNITVLNMLIGIVCEVVSEVKKDDEQAAAVQLMQQHLRGMLCELDADGDDSISRKELQDVVRNQKAVSVLRQLEVEPEAVLVLTEALFEDDEDAGREAKVTREELLEVILKIRGNREVTMQDIISAQMDLRKVVLRETAELMDMVKKLEPK